MITSQRRSRDSSRDANLPVSNRAQPPVATIFPNCYRTRRGFHLRMLQVTLSAAKLGAKVGGVHEKARPGGTCRCINRREDQGTWGLAREDARKSARNHTR